MSLLKAHEALAGKTAIVIGGAAGYVGRGVTLALAEAGVTIATCDNDSEGLTNIVPEVEALGSKILAVEADVRDANALDAFFDQVEDAFPAADMLINIPGGGSRGNFMDRNREQDAQDIRLNYGYVLDTVRRAVPLLQKSGGGSIVNFTTIEAHRGAATFAVYAGAKAAITNFSRAIALELGADQIRVNCVALDTSPARASNGMLSPDDFERLSKLAPDALEKAIEFYVPQKRNPTIADVTNGVLYLVSDLSRAVTGTTLHIDGGTKAAMGFLDWPGGDGFMPAPLGGTLPKLLG